MTRACSFILSAMAWAVSAALWWALLPAAALQKFAGLCADANLEDMKEIIGGEE